MEKNFFGRHYGWAMVVFVFIFLASTWGVVFNANSLFLVPIEESLQISREQTMIANIFRGIAMTIGAFCAGPLYLRFSFLAVNRLMGIGVILFYTLTAFMQSAFQYYILQFFLVFCMTICGLMAGAMLIKEWFQTKRGVALGVALTGSAVGGTLFSMLAGLLIPQLGWRNTVLVFAVQMAFFILLSHFKLYVYAPHQLGLKPYGSYDINLSKPEVIEPDPSPVARILFFLLSFGILMTNTSINVLMTNLPPHLESLGIAIGTQSMIVSVMMMSMAVSKIVLGYFYDVFGMRVASLMTALALLISYLGLLFPAIPGALYISAIGLGFGSSFNSLGPPIFAQALFGATRFTRINALFQSISGFGFVLSPIIVGFLFSIFGNYGFIFTLFACVCVFVSLIWIVGLPKKNNQPKKLGA